MPCTVLAFAWLGISDAANEGHFRSLSSGHHISFTNWRTGEPNNHNVHGRPEGDCAVIISDSLEWKDTGCADRFHVICEKM